MKFTIGTLHQLAPGINIFLREAIGNRSIAAIDMDDVLYPCTKALLADLNRRHGSQVTMDQLYRFDLHRQFSLFGGKHEKFLSYLINEVDYMNTELLYDYARPMMDVIHKEGLFSLVLTSRGFHPKGYANTHNMLTKSNVRFDGLATVGIKFPKLDFMFEYFDQPVGLVAEDSPIALGDFQEHTDAYLVKFERQWNLDAPYHTCVPENSTTDQVVASIEDALNLIPQQSMQAEA